VLSAYTEKSNIAFGNVVGSNIFNVLLILGLAAVIAPLYVSRQLVILDVPIMIGASVAVMVFGLDGRIGRLDGFFLFGALLCYLGHLFFKGRSGAQLPATDLPAPEEVVLRAASSSQLRNIGLLLCGLGMLVLGSHWLVRAAVEFAGYLGVSELVIGLTVVAVGTSLPELATSAVASARGERDIAVGNVVGSNIFNLLCVLGISGLVSPHGISVSPQALHFDLPAMIAVAVACLPIFFVGNKILRWEGALFLGYGGIYIMRTVLDATDSARLDNLDAAMLLFVIPLTLTTIGVVTVREWRARHNGHH